MANIASDKAMFFAIAMFAIVANLSFSGVAFADAQNGLYSYSHERAPWDPGIICDDHRCASGEFVIPMPVVPVRGH